MGDRAEAGRSADELAAVERFRRLLRIPTISRLDEATTDWAPFAESVQVLPELHLSLHSQLEREMVDDHSLLYRWRGSDSGAPAVLMAHYDVVIASDEGWEHPPQPASKFFIRVLGDGAASRSMDHS